MNVGECMKRQVISIPETTSIAKSAEVFVRYHIGMLPVLNA